MLPHSTAMSVAVTSSKPPSATACSMQARRFSCAGKQAGRQAAGKAGGAEEEVRCGAARSAPRRLRYAATWSLPVPPNPAAWRGCHTGPDLQHQTAPCSAGRQAGKAGRHNRSLRCMGGRRHSPAGSRSREARGWVQQAAGAAGAADLQAREPRVAHAGRHFLLRHAAVELDVALHALHDRGVQVVCHHLAHTFQLRSIPAGQQAGRRAARRSEPGHCGSTGGPPVVSLARRKLAHARSSRSDIVGTSLHGLT